MPKLLPLLRPAWGKGIDGPASVRGAGDPRASGVVVTTPLSKLQRVRSCAATKIRRCEVCQEHWQGLLSLILEWHLIGTVS